MTVRRSEVDGGARQYDLDERTALFGEETITFCKSTRHDLLSEPLIRQLVRAATSIGVNYCKADDATSKKEFRYRIGVCRREAREPTYRLRMIAKAAPDSAPEARRLWQEAKELNLIFGSIVRRTRRGPDAASERLD